MLHFYDPEDQESTLKVIKQLGAASSRELLRVIFVISMISNEAVLEEIGGHVKSKSYDYLEKLFRKRKEENKPTFRGGQFAGAVPVEGLAGALREFCQKALRKLTPQIVQWQEARKDRCRCLRALRNILSSIEKIRVFGFGIYKKKSSPSFSFWLPWLTYFLCILSSSG